MATGARPGAVATVLVAAGVVSSLVYSLAIPLLGEFPAIFSISASDATWIIVANSVSGAVTTPLTGRMGDTWGPRRTLLGTMACLAVGSVICALATSLEVMLVGRVLQGVAAGTVPLAIGIVRHVVPRERMGAVIGSLSATLGLGSGVGITLAGVILAHGSWRLVFAFTALLAAFVFLMVLRLVPGETALASRGIDVWGAVGLGVVLSGVLIPLSKGTEWGWGARPVWVMLVTAGIVGVLWSRHQWRRPKPMVNLRLALTARFGGTLLLSVVVGGTIFFSLLTVVVVLQAPAVTGYGLGRTALVAGLCLIPGNLMMLVAPFPAAWGAREWGVLPVLRIGLLIVAGGYLFRYVFDNTLPEVVLGYLVVQTGVAVCLAGLPMAVNRSAPARETSSAQALSTTMRQAGIAAAGAGYAALVASLHVDWHGRLFPTSLALDVSFLIGIAIALVGVAGTFVAIRPRN